MFWKRLVFIVSMLLLVGACFAAKTNTKPTTTKPATTTPSVPQVIKAQTIQLTDSAGNIRASMGAAVDGPAVFRLFDKDGHATVSIDSDGKITVLNSEGKPKVTVGQMGDEYGIGLYNSKGEIRADLTMSDDEPIICMRDASGNIRSMFYILDDEPFLTLSDGKNDGASLAFNVKESIPAIGMWDKNGKLRTTYKLASSDNSPFITLSDENGKSCMELYSTSGLPGISMMSPTDSAHAFLGFTDNDDVSLDLTDDANNSQVAIYYNESAGPNVIVCHPNGKPASRMGLYESGVPYFLSTDENETALWRSQ